MGPSREELSRECEWNSVTRGEGRGGAVAGARLEPSEPRPGLTVRDPGQVTVFGHGADKAADVPAPGPDAARVEELRSDLGWVA